jgi:methylase of polypeptide subunit release factors
MDLLDIERWSIIGRTLEASDGVHRPSTFSALLAATVVDCRDLVVVDAGCGAGLVTIAALAAGARHVVAQDHDGTALADTAQNVTRILGAAARRRLSFWEAGWDLLGPVRADLLAVNPPQRPSALLPDVPQSQRHLHVDGGADGLDGLRLILAHTSADRVRTTATALLDVSKLTNPRWSTPHLVANADLPFDPAWRALVPDQRGRVDIWETTNLVPG